MNLMAQIERKVIQDMQADNGGLLPIGRTQMNKKHSMGIPYRFYGKGASEAVKSDFTRKALAIAVAAIAVDSLPETRDDLIEGIKAKIDRKEYQVPSHILANSIFAHYAH